MGTMDDAGPRRTGRGSRHTIAEALRQRILDGTYPPGSRIPTHRALAEEFGISSVTLQRAIDRLAEFGLVEARGSLGTFVPATVSAAGGVIALVFHDQPNEGSWNRFLATLQRSAEALGTERSLRFRPYFMDHGRATCASAKRLYADAASGVLAGIAFVCPPWYLDPRLCELPLPRVVIGGNDDEFTRYRATTLHFVSATVRHHLLCGFAAAGRRRLAVLRPSGIWEDHTVEAAAVGLELRPAWNLAFPVDPVSAVSARTVTHLLCSRSAPDRPDCLLIEDDNLVPHVTAGIVDAGLLPVDIALAAHANFPDVTRSAVPCLRYGYDAARLLDLVLTEIPLLAAGQPPRAIEVVADLRTADAG